MSPYLDDGDLRLYHGDAIEQLRQLPDGSVDMVATSPPFYGLRDYGVDGQIGLEETPDEWVARLVAVFRECRRVLADHGTLWVEIGDSYSGSGKGGQSEEKRGKNWQPTYPRSYRSSMGHGERCPSLNPKSTGKDQCERRAGHAGDHHGKSHSGSVVIYPSYWTDEDWKHDSTEALVERSAERALKPKDLLGQPWLLAFALRADGWYLRSEIIWARPNPMPESVTDRPTKAHSTVFLLSKRPRYFYDADAIREPFSQATVEREKYGYNHAYASQFRGHPTDKRHVDGKQLPPATLDGSNGEAPRGPDGRRQTTVTKGDNSEQHRDGERWPNPTGANARSVWTIPTEPTPFAHFATWPQALVRRMILAGTSERGKCPECGKPLVRETEPIGEYAEALAKPSWASGGLERGAGANKTTSVTRTVATVGWSPSCACDRQPVPCVVLDPFAGGGTTLLVARNHGRHAIGIELNDDYCRIAAERLQQLSLLAQPQAGVA